jgi:hypothetical protein
MKVIYIGQKTCLRRYKSPFENLEISFFFVNFGQFQCPRFRIQESQINADHDQYCKKVGELYCFYIIGLDIAYRHVYEEMSNLCRSYS